MNSFQTKKAASIQPPWNNRSYYGGEYDANGVAVAQFSINESQVIPVNIHHLLKHKSPNLATIRFYFGAQS